MAFKIAKGFAEFTAVDAPLQRVCGRMRASLKKVQAHMAGVSKIARTMLLVGAGAMYGVVRAGGSYEQSMARVRALTGATADEFTRLQEKAKELGRTTIFSAKQAADAMAFFALAGFNVNKIIAAMPHTLRLAAAGQMDVAQAADIVAKVMAGMQIGADRLGNTVDVLAKAFTTANTDLSMLGEALKYVGPLGATAGKGLNEIIAAIQMMSDAGIQASMAGTSLRMSLIRLADQSGAGARQLRKLRVSALDAAGDMRPMADIVDDLNAAMVKMGKGAKIAVMKEIFGARAASGMAAILAKGGKAFREYEARLASAGGTAERIARIQLDTTFGSLTLLKSAVEGVAISLHEAFSPMVRFAAERLQKVAARMADMTEATKKAIVKYVALTAGVLGVVYVLPKLLGAIAVIIGVFQGLTAVLLSPFVLATAGVVTLAAAIVGSGDVLAGFKTIVGRVRDFAVKAFEDMALAVFDYQNTLGRIKRAAEGVRLGLKESGLRARVEEQKEDVGLILREARPGQAMMKWERTLLQRDFPNAFRATKVGFDEWNEKGRLYTKESIARLRGSWGDLRRAARQAEIASVKHDRGISEAREALRKQFRQEAGFDPTIKGLLEKLKASLSGLVPDIGKALREAKIDMALEDFFGPIEAAAKKVGAGAGAPPPGGIGRGQAKVAFVGLTEMWRKVTESAQEQQKLRLAQDQAKATEGVRVEVKDMRQSNREIVALLERGLPAVVT